ncbi:MAG: hypothetical protein HKP61_14895 [Dactylosporangium sp.]|nr:hypothetical protein [Dactylosporangium sp.]NNJ62197.1 hypothetical protein [Dactylosporangium sp.]
MILSLVLTIALFATAVALIGIVELVSRREQSAVPTLGEMCGFVMTYRLGWLPVGRIAVLGFWWWVGWHFFAR